MSCWTLARLLSQWEKKRVCKEEKIQMCAERAPFAYSLSNLSRSSFLWRALLSSGRNYSREEAVLVSLLDFCPALGCILFFLYRLIPHSFKTSITGLSYWSVWDGNTGFDQLTRHWA